MTIQHHARPIPRVTRAEFERTYFPANQPAIIVESLRNWRAVGLWTHEYLAETYRTKRVVVGASIETTRQGESPALESGFWIKHVDEEMDFPTAIDLIVGNTATNRHYYLYRRSVPDEYPELYSDISIPPWVPVKQPRINLWIGGANHVTTCHYDTDNNFFAQVYGHKSFTIYAPEDTPYLYPHPVETEHADISAMDIEKPDLLTFPNFPKARPIEGLVGPGDLLYLPSRWWHHVKSLDHSISVNFWWPASFEQTLAPNELRRAPMHYRHDRLSQFKATMLDPSGTSLIDLARLLGERRYYLPAVLAAGAALDETIRQLCRQRHIPDRHGQQLRDLERLNEELSAAEVYSTADAEQVRDWNALVEQALAADNVHYQMVDDRLLEPAAVHAQIDGITEFCQRMEQTAQQPAADDLEFDISF